MNVKDIEKIFTETADAYIKKGYTFSTATMGGSQGEVAKVDLTNGKEIVRIRLNRTTEWFAEKEEMFFANIDAIVLTVGYTNDKKFFEKRRPFDTFCTVWDNDLTMITERKFYTPKNDANYFTENVEEAKATAKKQLKRYSDRKVDQTTVLKAEAKKAVLSFVKRQPRCKTMKVDDIKQVRKIYYTNYIAYIVDMKNGKSFRIK